MWINFRRRAQPKDMGDPVKSDKAAEIEDDDDEEEFFDNEDDDEIFETMDDSPMQIQPGLFIGSFMAEQNKPKLKRAGITHILQVAEGMAPSHPADFKYAMVAVQDHPGEDLAAHFVRAFAFIDDALGQQSSEESNGAVSAPGASGGDTSGQANGSGRTISQTSSSGQGPPCGSTTPDSTEKDGGTSSTTGNTPCPTQGSTGTTAGSTASGTGGSTAGSSSTAAGPSTTEIMPDSGPAAVAGGSDGQPRGGVLVHCVAGVSRSSTVCIGWLMWKHHISYDEAFRRVHAVRPWVMPNPGFRQQLKEFEENGWDPAKWRAWRHRHPEAAGACVSLSGLHLRSRPPAALGMGSRDESGRPTRPSLDDCGLGTSF